MTDYNIKFYVFYISFFLNNSTLTDSIVTLIIFKLFYKIYTSFCYIFVDPIRCVWGLGDWEEVLLDTIARKWYAYLTILICIYLLLAIIPLLWNPLRIHVPVN